MSAGAAPPAVGGVLLPRMVVVPWSASSYAAARRDLQLETRLDDGGADRIVAAARAEGADGALVVAPGEAELVGRQGGVVQLRLWNKIQNSGKSWKYRKAINQSSVFLLGMPARMKFPGNMR